MIVDGGGSSTYGTALFEKPRVRIIFVHYYRIQITSLDLAELLGAFSFARVLQARLSFLKARLDAEQ